MCNPAGLLVGGLGMGAVSTYMGVQAAGTEQEFANASAAFGYAGAIDEYNAQQTAINAAEDWKWNDYRTRVADRQKAMDYANQNFQKTRSATLTDFAGKTDALRAGLCGNRRVST